MTYTAGILIVGSLYWSTRDHRLMWRKTYLKAGAEVAVSAPIRYGRRSREDTYTMVFSPNCPEGKARVCGCRSSVSSPEELVAEAEALWLAESPDGSVRRPTEKLAANWGCVALLINPNSNVPSELVGAWVDRVAQERPHRTTERSYDPRGFSAKGISAIDERGFLQIAWPKRLDTHELLAGFDLLLATATRPTLDPNTGDYPAVAVIADAWNKKRDAGYFRSNRANGFHTFQDEAIKALLRV